MSTRPADLDALHVVFSRIESGWGEVAKIIALGDEALSLRAEKVSAWSVTEQVDHLLKVERSIYSHLLTRTPAPGPRISLAGRFVLATGWIPRGKSESPRGLRGTPARSGELAASLETCREVFRRLAAEPDPLLSPAAVLPHKMFGALTAGEAIRFAPIHTRHHLKIAADIRRSSVGR
jgi:hypothetical protein